MMRKYHVRFGGGPMEKYQRNRWQLAGGLPNPNFARVAAATGIEELRTAYRAPRQNATCERFLGSVRRECLDHALVLGEAHLRRVLREYVAYFNYDRPHQGLRQRIPDPATVRTLRPEDGGPMQAVPVLGGLHHTYLRAA